MIDELDVLKRRLARWDPDGDDLPDDLARAMDRYPELRAIFDARFEAVDLSAELIPSDLATRVIPVSRGRVRFGGAGALALAAAVMFAVGAWWMTVPPPSWTSPEGSTGDPVTFREPEGELVPVAAPVTGELRVALFDPSLPPSPRRLPVRPLRYTQAPPGGRFQYEAVAAARRRDCPTALVEAKKGLEVSIDHATLFRGIWLCFNEAHQRQLEQATAYSFADFAFLLEHFEGSPEAMDKALDRDPALRKVPRWYRAPVGGIEFRLRHFIEDEMLVDMVGDIFGEPTITDHLAKDVHLEAQAAVGLARVPVEDRTPALIDTWARRVYTTALALRLRPGRYLDAHRPELIPLLRDLLDVATVDAPDVPAVVLHARRVGEGEARVKQPRSVATCDAACLQQEIREELERYAEADCDGTVEVHPTPVERTRAGGSPPR